MLTFSTVSEIRICNPVFRKIFARIFSMGVCYEIDSKKLKNSNLSGGALMAGQMRMSLNTVPVTDNPTISMVI